MDNEGCYCWQVLLEAGNEHRGELWSDYLPRLQELIEHWARNEPKETPLSLGDDYFLHWVEDGFVCQISPSGRLRKVRRVREEGVQRD